MGTATAVSAGRKILSAPGFAIAVAEMADDGRAEQLLRADSNLRQRSLDLGGLAGLAFVHHAVGERVLPCCPGLVGQRDCRRASPAGSRTRGRLTSGGGQGNAYLVPGAGTDGQLQVPARIIAARAPPQRDPSTDQPQISGVM